MDWRGVARSRCSMRGMGAIATTREMPSRIMGGKLSLNLHRPVLRETVRRRKRKEQWKNELHGGGETPWTDDKLCGYDEFGKAPASSYVHTKLGWLRLLP